MLPFCCSAALVTIKIALCRLNISSFFFLMNASGMPFGCDCASTNKFQSSSTNAPAPFSKKPVTSSCIFFPCKFSDCSMLITKLITISSSNPNTSIVFSETHFEIISMLTFLISILVSRIAANFPAFCIFAISFTSDFPHRPS